VSSCHPLIDALVVFRMQDLRSLRCSAMLKLNQACKFKDIEKIYFPYNLDFRGRACKFMRLRCDRILSRNSLYVLTGPFVC
jgi:hypothetical protein